MILITAIVAGLLLGVVLGGSPKELAALRLRWVLLALVALVIQRMVTYWPEPGEGWPQLRAMVVSASYGLLLLFTLANLALPPMRLIALGIFLNALVILANGGAMPVTREALLAARFHPGIEELKYGDPVPGTKEVLLSKGDTALWPLSDVFVLPAPDPVGTTFSIGDVLIAAGAFWLVFTGSKPNPSRFRRQFRGSDSGQS